MNQLLTYGTKTLNQQELQEVRNLLKDDPKLWRTLGDVTTWSREHTLGDIPERTVKYECVQAGIRQMRHDLLQEGASQLERMIVEQIITCWLQLGNTGNRLESLPPTDENQKKLQQLERRYSQDHIRFNRAISLLTRTRRSLFDLGVRRCEIRPRYASHYKWEVPYEPESETTEIIEIAAANPEPIPMIQEAKTHQPREKPTVNQTFIKAPERQLQPPNPTPRPIDPFLLDAMRHQNT